MFKINSFRSPQSQVLRAYNLTALTLCAALIGSVAGHAHAGADSRNFTIPIHLSDSGWTPQGERLAAFGFIAHCPKESHPVLDESGRLGAGVSDFEQFGTRTITLSTDDKLEALELTCSFDSDTRRVYISNDGITIDINKVDPDASTVRVQGQACWR